MVGGKAKGRTEHIFLLSRPSVQSVHGLHTAAAAAVHVHVFIRNAYVGGEGGAGSPTWMNGGYAAPKDVGERGGGHAEGRSLFEPPPILRLLLSNRGIISHPAAVAATGSRSPITAAADLKLTKRLGQR